MNLFMSPPCENLLDRRVAELLQPEVRQLARAARMADGRGRVPGERLARGQQVLPGLEPQRPLGARALNVRLRLREHRLPLLAPPPPPLPPPDPHPPPPRR